MLLRVAWGKGDGSCRAGGSRRSALRELALGIAAGLGLLRGLAFDEPALIVTTGLGVSHVCTERQNGESGNRETTKQHGQ